jgi:sec-independent protein translocase protein TatA
MHNSVYLFLNMGTGEVMLIFFVALLLFGGEKMPGIARTLGRGIRDFKNASEDVKREINNQINNFDEKKERKEAPKQIEESYAAEETPVSEEKENLTFDNNVDNPVAEDNDTVVTESEPAQEAAAPQEKKKIDFTKPEGTVEYKG